MILNDGSEETNSLFRRHIRRRTEAVNNKRNVADLREKVAQYRALARMITDSQTARLILALTDELEQQARDMERGKLQSSMIAKARAGVANGTLAMPFQHMTIAAEPEQRRAGSRKRGPSGVTPWRLFYHLGRLV